MNSVQDKAQELNSEFDNVFAGMKDAFKNDPIKIQAFIDKIAAERDWNQSCTDKTVEFCGKFIFCRNFRRAFGNVSDDDSGKSV